MRGFGGGINSDNPKGLTFTIILLAAFNLCLTGLQSVQRAVCELGNGGRTKSYCSLQGKIAVRPERTVDEVPTLGTRNCER